MNEPALKYNDDVERLIAEHNGDVQAAIAVLLSERNFLIKELEYASLIMAMASPEAGGRRCSRRGAGANSPIG